MSRFRHHHPHSQLFNTPGRQDKPGGHSPPHVGKVSKHGGSVVLVVVVVGAATQTQFSETGVQTSVPGHAPSQAGAVVPHEAGIEVLVTLVLVVVMVPVMVVVALHAGMHPPGAPSLDTLNVMGLFVLGVAVAVPPQ